MQANITELIEICGDFGEQAVHVDYEKHFNLLLLEKESFDYEITDQDQYEVYKHLDEFLVNLYSNPEKWVPTALVTCKLVFDNGGIDILRRPFNNKMHDRTLLRFIDTVLRGVHLLNSDLRTELKPYIAQLSEHEFSRSFIGTRSIQNHLQILLSEI